MMRNSIARAAIFALIFTLLATNLSSAAPLLPGSLDPNFGYFGYYVGPDNETSPGPIALLPDGKFLMAGSFRNSNMPNWDMIVARFGADGFPDLTFGKFGSMAFVDFGNNDYGTALVVQPGGKIVVAGVTVAAAGSQLALARFTADGSLDDTFGMAGKVVTDFGSSLQTASDIGLDSTGEIIVAGEASDGFYLAKYGADGSPDAGFGTGGKITTAFNGTIGTNVRMNILPGNKIFLVGTLKTTGSSNDQISVAFARYSANGALDTTFGTSGKASIPFTHNDFFQLQITGDMAFQPNGKVLYAATQNTTLFLLRFNNNGTLDPAFGTGGVLTHTLSQGDITAGLTLQPDGKFILVGETSGNDAGNYYRRFLVMRFLPGGAFDPNFGTGGRVVTDFPYFLASARTATILPNAQILVVGSAYDLYSQAGLARYFGDVKAYMPLVVK